MSLTLSPLNGVPSAWAESLRQSGFQSGAAGYTLDGFTFRWEDRWVTLEHADNPEAPITSEPMTAPGLWKEDGEGSAGRRRFETPSALLQTDDTECDGGEGRLSLASWLKWARETAGGAAPRGWTPPTADQLAEWVPAAALNVQRGAFVRQGQTVLEPGRLAFEFPVLLSLPDALPAPRAAWLDALVREANRRWRLIRFGIVPRVRSRSLVARIDFTGAPHSPALFSTGLEALKYGTAWLGESAELLANTEQTLEALAAPPPKTQPRKEPHDECHCRNHH